MPPVSEYQPLPVPAAINILDVVKGVARRKLFILGTTVIAFAIGMGVVTVLKPVYKSQAQVLIQNLETPFDRVQPVEGQRTDAIDDRVVASQISVIKSQDLGRRVVAALGLDNNPEFNVLLAGQGTLGGLKVKLGFGSDPAQKTPEQRALDHYLDKLNVFQLPDSNVIGIEFSSSNPETSAKISNTLADTFVMWTRESQSQPTERARDWLSGQIDALRKKLAASEEAVEKYRAEAGLLKGATVTLGEQEISELNSQITVAKAASLEARAKADSIRDILESRGSVDGATDVLNSITVQRLKEQRTEAMRRMSELSATYLSNHPKMQAVKNEISNIDRQIRAEALRVVSSLDEQARIAEAREKSLVASLETLKNQESSANLSDVKLKALERDTAADRVLLEALLSRYAEASARQDLSAQPGLAVITQTASVPTTPTFPKTGPTVTLITIAGLAAGLALAFLLELMAAATRLPQLGEVVPRVEPSLEPIAAAAPVVPGPLPAAATVAEPMPEPVWTPPPVLSVADPLAVWPRAVPQRDVAGFLSNPEVGNAVRQMSQWLQAVRRDLDVKCMGLTTLGGGPADSPLASLALARMIAIAGKRVIVVDIARSASLLGGLAGVAHGPGLSDLVSGSADFTKVISRDTGSPVHVLRFGMDHSPRAMALILERIGSVLDALSRAYDFVLVNLGEASEDTPIFLHKCQGALLLAPPSRVNEVTQALQTLLDTGLLAAQYVMIGQEPANPAMQQAHAAMA
jgi:succinoglycan biosynthesis transport protein ExoP